MKFSVLALLGFALSSVSALNAAQWRSQSIYQVLTDRFAQTSGSNAACSNLGDYCGGTWQGLINKLDYIQGMGFTAVWISPVVKNVEGNTPDGSGYHGYWAQDIYAVNQHFGTSSGLKALSSALHERGMYLMVDIVVNHMAYIGSISSVNYAGLNPFNSQNYFHSYCPINYDNQQDTERCWMGDNIVPLPDLKTEDSTVRSMWQTWVKQLVANYTIDGLRLDTTSQVEQSFYPAFVEAAGVYVIGEVFNGNPSYTCPYTNYLPGVLNYPSYFWTRQAFQNSSGSIANLVNGIAQMKQACSDTTTLGSFLENHDNPRYPVSVSDNALIQNAIAFTMLADGIPIIYYGQEQKFRGDAVPSNREALWTSGYSTTSPFYVFIKSVNALRNRAIKQSSTYVTYKASSIYSDRSTIAMRKGDTGSQIIGVFTNQGSSASSSTITLSSSATGFTANQALVEILGCTAYTTDSAGNLGVRMTSGAPRIFYPRSQLSGSGICSGLTDGGGGDGGGTGTTTLSTSTIPSTSVSPSSTACPTSSQFTVSVKVTTTWGQTVKIVGNVPQLGNWDPSKGVALSAGQYTSSNPVWSGTVAGLSTGGNVQYKYVRVNGDGTVTWEKDPNRSLAIAACQGNVQVGDSWQE